MICKVYIFCLLLVSFKNFINAYTSEALADQIINLPGASNLDVTFNQFSGYLNIEGSSGEKTKFMHYW